MALYSIREVIEMAVQAERLGGEFYADLAGKYENDGDLKELFTRLAEREKVHETVFLKMMDAAGGEEPEGWEEVEDYMRAIVESAFFIGREKATAHLASIEDYRAAVAFALAFEKETLLFYYCLRDSVREKEKMDEIIEEEKRHIKWLGKLKGR